MSARTIYDCDRCGAPDASPIETPVNLGDGEYRPDLCADCKTFLGLDRLIYLATEYGVVVNPDGGEVNGTKGDKAHSGKIKRSCPVCKNDYVGGRAALVTHLQNVHGMSIVEASHAVPFTGPAATCEQCGYYGPQGGMTLHTKAHERAAA